jgi:GNAT superfamily N-acetyltransferase
MNIALRHRQTDTSAIEIRLASLDDIPAMVAALRAFFDETPWGARGVSFDAESVERFLQFSTPRGSQPYLLALDHGRIVGLISWHYYRDYTDPIAVMDETYVAPDFRRTNLARKLVALALHMANGDGARIMNFPLCSGLDATRTYVNMLRKFGAEMTGVMMTKVL